MTIPDFVAIDFETANPRRASAIQIGIVRVIGGVVQEPFTSPVLPPLGFREFREDQARIHGLGESYIVGAPAWREIHDRIVRFADGLPLVAHNASFERSVINAASLESGFTPHPFDYVCTLKMARRMLPEQDKHRLDTLAELFGIRQERHHDAGDDARVGAELALALVQRDGGERLFSSLMYQ